MTNILRHNLPLFSVFALHHIFNNSHLGKNSTHISNNNSTYKSKNEDKAKAKFISAVTYPNANTYKLDVLKDNNNNNKTGIYKWTNKLTGKFYIGSAINLKSRFINYYNISYLETETIDNNSIIYKSLLKHGYCNFKLDIIEYCSPEDLIKREQYYYKVLNLIITY